MNEGEENHRGRALARLILGAAAAVSACAAARAAPPAKTSRGYHLLRRVVLGGEGGWDYLTLDAASRRLYIARGRSVLVVDADGYEKIGELPATDGVHGIALAPELGRGFASNGKAGTVTIFDLATLARIADAAAGQNPDAILYDPASRRVFAFNGRTQDATVLDAAKGTPIGTIELGGRPEFAVADGRGRIYDNLEDKSVLMVLESRTLGVKARWPLAPCREPSGLALDAAHRRLFVACANRLMEVVDADGGKIVATLPIGERVDAAAYDPGTRLAFSSNGDGTLTVIREDSPNKFRVIQTVSTQRGARTMAVDPRTHRVFLVTAEFGQAPGPTARQPHPRPAVVPGTFTLLVFGR